MELEKPTFVETGDPSLLRKPDSNPHPEGTEKRDWTIGNRLLAEMPAADEQPLPEQQ